MLIRLSKYLKDAGICARRKAEILILDGRVCVNGIVVDELGTKVETEADVVTLDGNVVTISETFVYIMLNKPTGYVTTAQDEHNRPTIMELVADIDARLFAVGRLDYNTSGLLLMTNDGDLAYKLTHPKHAIKKTYACRVSGFITNSELDNFRKGVYIEDNYADYKTAPAQIIVTKADEISTSVKITIGEGKNRQVRKMIEAINHEVISLKRISTGRLSLSNLEIGTYRHLNVDEVEYLKGL